MKKVYINLILVLIIAIMLVTTISTSLQSNLFEVFPSLWEIPWFRTTLIDFYLNQFLIYLIVAYLEKWRWLKTIPWLILFICLGAMGSAIYFLYYLNKKKED